MEIEKLLSKLQSEIGKRANIIKVKTSPQWKCEFGVKRSVPPMYSSGDYRILSLASHQKLDKQLYRTIVHLRRDNKMLLQEYEELMRENFDLRNRLMRTEFKLENLKSE
jgi:hypothetical protein